MDLRYSYQTDVGRVRPHNEDAVHIFENDHLVVMVVADGMGGHSSGDVASKMAIQYVESQFHDQLQFANKEEAGVWLRHVLEQVNSDILA